MEEPQEAVRPPFGRVVLLRPRLLGAAAAVALPSLATHAIGASHAMLGETLRGVLPCVLGLDTEVTEWLLLLGPHRAAGVLAGPLIQGAAARAPKVVQPLEQNKRVPRVVAVPPLSSLSLHSSRLRWVLCHMAAPLAHGVPNRRPVRLAPDGPGCAVFAAPFPTGARLEARLVRAAMEERRAVLLCVRPLLRVLPRPFSQVGYVALA